MHCGCGACTSRLTPHPQGRINWWCCCGCCDDTSIITGTALRATTTIIVIIIVSNHTRFIHNNDIVRIQVINFVQATFITARGF